MKIFLIYLLMRWGIICKHSIFIFSNILEPKLMDFIFSTICLEKIIIKDYSFEKVLVKLIENNLNNFETIEHYLLLTKSYLNVKILERIIDCFYKVRCINFLEK
jgi:hypothetical protein